MFGAEGWALDSGDVKRFTDSSKCDHQVLPLAQMTLIFHCNHVCHPLLTFLWEIGLVKVNVRSVCAFTEMSSKSELALEISTTREMVSICTARPAKCPTPPSKPSDLCGGLVSSTSSSWAPEQEWHRAVHRRRVQSSYVTCNAMIRTCVQS